MMSPSPKPVKIPTAQAGDLVTLFGGGLQEKELILCDLGLPPVYTDVPLLCWRCKICPQPPPGCCSNDPDLGWVKPPKTRALLAAHALSWKLAASKNTLE